MYGDSVVFAVNTTPGNYQTFIYQMNSLFDPQFSSGGHQPRWFDQLCASGGPYLNYRVLGAKWRCTFSTQNGQGIPMSMLAYPSNTSTFSSDASLQEKAEVAGDGYCTVQPGGPVGVIVGSCSTHEIFNVAPVNVQTGDDFQALYSANPARLWFLMLACGASNVSNTTAVDGICEILMEYDVQFEGLYTGVAPS
jgi:hypothetical protein